MEIRRGIWPAYKKHLFCLVMVFLCMLWAPCLQAQPGAKKYTINNGNMQIMLGKALDTAELKAFIKQYGLEELALRRLLKDNFQDSVISSGWKIELNNREAIVISKPLFSADNMQDSTRRLTGTVNILGDFAPSSLDNQPLGYNIFRKNAFTVKDSVVTFLLRNNKNAQNVKLAGNFTNWETGALPMLHTDSGWALPIKLRPGKYLYKFIADGYWMTDPENKSTENDIEGNTNSVFYQANTVFRLEGFTNAKKVVLSGSFNHWQENRLRLNKTATGWALPVFLDTGTYTYRFIVDGKWMIDPSNSNRYPNEFDDFNSVIHIGTPTLLTLTGLTDAKKVFLAGSFNDWRDFELQMKKTNTGWEIPYVLGEGNYEYKFYADGRWYDSEGRPVKKDAPGSVCVIGSNHTFRLKGFENAKQVFLAGDFNGWSPNAFLMKKENGEWMLPVHLSPGKHLYKFVADGKWIKDPANELWEKNEFDGDNSILWIK